MEKQDQLLPNARRHVLHMAVASILNGHGFKKADKQCLETLTEVCMNKKPQHLYYSSSTLLT